MQGQGNHEQGNVLTVVLVGIIIFLATTNAAAITIALMNKEQYAPPASQPAPVAAEDISDDGRLLGNQDRENDAVLVADGAANYYSDNNNTFPASFANGSFTGPGVIKPQLVQLSFYRQVAVTSGAQKPIEGDNVRLVLKGACAASGGATAASTAVNAYVVQYTSQPKTGALEAKCYTPRS